MFKLFSFLDQKIIGVRLLISFLLLLSITSASPCDGNSDNPEIKDPVPIKIFIVGKVNDTTARLLIEVDKTSSTINKLSNAPVICIRSKSGTFVQGSGDKKRLMAGKATIFKFKGLQPQTEYSVIFDGVAFSYGSAGFQTHPLGGYKLSKDSPNMAAVSCNNVYKSQDHWKNLAKFVGSSVPSKDRISLLIHMGDQVYLDWDNKVRDYVDGWPNARKILNGKSSNQWMQYWDKIDAIFRAIYHVTWNSPVVAKILANVPNLMISDDHEFKDHWGQSCWNDISKLEWFIGKIAYSLVLEYQVQLHQDVDWTSSTLYSKTVPYHAHVLGDIGLLFIDIRSANTYYNPLDSAACDNSILGAPQTRWIQKNLKSTQFQNVKALLLVTSLPIVLFNKGSNKWITGYAADFNGSWAQYPDDQTRILDMLLDWKTATSSREAAIVSGDLHFGGFTIIKKNSNTLLQLLTSSIASQTLGKGKRNKQYRTILTLQQISHYLELQADWTFSHHKFVKEHNFGVIDFKKLDEPNMRPNIKMTMHVQGRESTEFDTATALYEYHQHTIIYVAALIFGVLLFCCCCCCIYKKCCKKKKSVTPA